MAFFCFLGAMSVWEGGTVRFIIFSTYRRQRFARALLGAGVALLAAAWNVSPAAAGVDEQVKQPVAEAIRIRQETQKDEDLWNERKQELLQRLETLAQAGQALSVREKTLREKNAATSRRVEEKKQALADMQDIQTRIAPFIRSQLRELNDHITTGLPFLRAERRRRLERLETMQADPDIAVSEKFRKVMEALQVEAEYGGTIEVCRETISCEGRRLLVDVLRLGSVGLFFQTLDARTCGFYNVATGAWETLAAGCGRDIQAAVDMGAKRRAAELVTLPIGRIRPR